MNPLTNPVANVHIRKRFIPLAAVSLMLGCPSQTSVQTDVSYPPRSTLSLSGPRCTGEGSCRCRPLDSNDDQAEAAITAGHKRFEFRLPRTTSAIWVDIEGRGHFYKAPENMRPACFYVDLPAGKHRVTIHSVMSDPEIGLQTGLFINEYGPKEGPFWYRTFELSCGGMNKCTKAGLNAWVDAMRRLPKGHFSPCGSVKLRRVAVGGTREQRLDTEYTDLTVRFTLEIYGFAPYQNPSSPECQVTLRPDDR